MVSKCSGFLHGILYPKGSTPLKWRDISVLFLSLFSTAMSITVLFPFLPAMVKHFGKSEEDTGYYAGIIASSMFFGRFFSSYFWGLLADKIGRRPVIIISALCIGLSTFLFGLSTSVAMAIATRLLVGLANGVIGTSKAIISELCDVTNQSLGMSTITCAFTSGLIIGPAVGGFLSETGTKYPNTFPKGSFFDRYPFMLPCLINSLLHLISSIIAYKWLPETLKARKKTNDDEGSLLMNGGSLQKQQDKKSEISSKYEEVNESENMTNEHAIMKTNETQNTSDENDILYTTKSVQETSNNEPAVSLDNKDDTENVSVENPRNSSREITPIDNEQSSSGVVAALEDVSNNSENVSVEGKSQTEIPECISSVENIDQKSIRNTSDKELNVKADDLPVVSYECKSGSRIHFEAVEEDSEKKHTERHQKLSCCSYLARWKKESNLWTILKNRDAVLMLVIYSVYSFTTIGVSEVVNFWAATSPRLGGLGFSTDAIGTFHLIIGIVMTIMQPTILPKVERKIGCLLNLQLSVITLMFFAVITPSIRIVYNRSSILWPLLLICLAMKQIAVCSGYLSIFLLTNNSVNSDLLCSINGLAMSLASLIKGVGPTVGGSLFAWSISTGRNIGFPFNINLTFIVFGLVLVLIAFVSCFVSESLNESKENDRDIMRKSVENLVQAKI